MSHIKGTITINEIGLELVAEWTIDYFSLLEGSTTCYKSPEFSFDGERWQLWIYPRPWYVNESSHVKLCLDKCHSGRSNIYSSSFSLKTVKGEKYNEQCGKRFSDGDYKNYQFKRYIPISELIKKESDLVPDGILTVVCTMKRWTSAGSEKGQESNAGVNKSDVAEASGSSQAGTTTTKESDAEENKSYMAEASGSSPAGTTTTKEAVLKRIEENCEAASKGKKRKNETENDEACASEFSTSPHLKKLHDDLKDLFLKRDNCDIIIRVKGSEIPAHRVILQARSPVFASTFQHNMKEKSTGIVEIEDCDPSPFMDFLRYIYYGDVGMISHENAFELFRLADKYEVLDLRATCLEFMKLNIALNNFCETITMALQHAETELIAVANDFFVKNAEEILQTVKWQTFAVENPTQSNELVIKLVKWFKNLNVCISCQNQNIA